MPRRIKSLPGSPKQAMSKAPNIWSYDNQPTISLEQTTACSEGAYWIQQVFNHMAHCDHIEGILREIRSIDPTHENVKSMIVPGHLCSLLVRLYAYPVPAQFLHAS
jgi:hypothetical protein